MNNDFVFNPTRTANEIAAIQLENLDPRSGLVKKWSFSSLKKFESCPHSIFLKYIKQLKEESGPAAERGVKIHKLAEDYVSGLILELPVELKKFETSFLRWHTEYPLGKIHCEYEMAFTVDWKPCDWNDNQAWARFILDLFIQDDETSAQVKDHKTGRKEGNEIKHAEQSLMYACALFQNFPALQYVESEFLYLDEGTVMKKSYTREYCSMFLPKIDARAKRMTTETTFIARPSKSNCRWCYYAKTKQCEWAEPTL